MPCFLNRTKLLRLEPDAIKIPRSAMAVFSLLLGHFGELGFALHSTIDWIYVPSFWVWINISRKSRILTTLKYIRDLKSRRPYQPSCLCLVKMVEDWSNLLHLQTKSCHIPWFSTPTLHWLKSSTHPEKGSKLIKSRGIRNSCAVWLLTTAQTCFDFMLHVNYPRDDYYSNIVSYVFLIN